MWDWLTELFGGGEGEIPGLSAFDWGGKPTGENWSTATSFDVEATPDSPSAMSDAQGNMPSVKTEDDEVGEKMSNKEIMGLGLGILGLLGNISASKSQENIRRSQLRIDEAGLEINKTLADGAYRVQKIALSTQFEDLRGQVSQAANKERKLYESSAAKMLVKQAEAGQSGQSTQDVQMTLSRGHEEYQNMLISNSERTETMLLYKGSALMDQHTAQTAQYNINKAGLVAERGYGSEWGYALGNLDDYGLDAYMAYLQFTA
jgi:hypothetical protein